MTTDEMLEAASEFTFHVFTMPRHEYDFYETIRVCHRGTEDDIMGDSWAVLSYGSQCWSESTGEWEWELSPSNRPDDFIERTRYPRDVALAIAKRLHQERG